LTRQYFHLTVPDVTGQASKPEKSKFSAEKWVGAIIDGYSPFTLFGDERGIALVEAFPRRFVLPEPDCLSGE
jgi:hypothetical protein